MRVLFQNDWYRLERVGPRSDWLTRSSQPMVGREEMDLAHEQLTAALEHIRPRALVVDVREAPLRIPSSRAASRTIGRASRARPSGRRCS